MWFIQFDKTIKKFKIKKFIFISTDKAVNPTSIMGEPERTIENYITYLQDQNDNQDFSIVSLVMLSIQMAQ